MAYEEQFVNDLLLGQALSVLIEMATLPAKRTIGIFVIKKLLWYAIGRCRPRERNLMMTRRSATKPSVYLEVVRIVCEDSQPLRMIFQTNRDIDIVAPQEEKHRGFCSICSVFLQARLKTSERRPSLAVSESVFRNFFATRFRGKAYSFVRNIGVTRGVNGRAAKPILWAHFVVEKKKRLIHFDPAPFGQPPLRIEVTNNEGIRVDDAGNLSEVPYSEIAIIAAIEKVEKILGRSGQ